MAATQVLIVDDNRSYREAFRRNLILRGYDVLQAEDAPEALDLLQANRPDVVVTDLAMRHPTEGLDLIRQVRALRRDLPVIMISAVGTFDEGAEAMRLGASQVISKSRIDEEMESLYKAIDDASRQYLATRDYQDQVTALAEEARKDQASAIATLTDMLKRTDVPQGVKSEAFDLLAELTRDESGRSAMDPGAKKLAEAPANDLIEQVDKVLSDQIARYETLDNETRQNLRTAEFLFQSGGSKSEVDFSRSMGFAYCFAVENEAKARLKKKLHKFFGDPKTGALLRSLLEKNGRNISVFYQQHLLRAQQGIENEASIENFYHAFQRILEHGSRYKPDGLKALGIVLICFGRTYTFKNLNQDVTVDNPLGLKGFANPTDVIKFAGLLINLQHYRNPYIHPELSEMIKLSHIRETAFACLNMIVQIQ